MYSDICWNDSSFRMMWSWNRVCHVNSYPKRRACFETADLYDRTMVEIELGVWGNAGHEFIFCRDVAYRRDVACNVSTCGGVHITFFTFRFIVVQYQYTMHMVWHNHIICKYCVLCVVFYFVPQDIGQNTNVRQLHDTVFNVTKKRISVFRAYCNEISAIPAIIPWL